MSLTKLHLYESSGEAEFDEQGLIPIFATKNGFFGRCMIGSCTWEGQEHRYPVLAESDADLHRICSHRE
jgi:hypothetical protein